MNNKIEKSNKLISTYMKQVDTTLPGGKHLRGCLTLLIQDTIIGVNTTDCIKVASAIDMVHNTSLLVDDFIDDDETRRGISSFHIGKKNKEIILQVIYELAQPYAIINAEIHDSGKKHSVLTKLIDTQTTMSKGVLSEIKDNVKNVLHPSEIYLNLLAKKTGALFGLAAYTGATLSGLNDEECGFFYEFGKEAGVMYQITDDILDIEGVLCGKKLPGTEILLLRVAGAGSLVEELIKDIKCNTVSCKKVKLLVNDEGLLMQLEKILLEQKNKVEKAFAKIPEKYRDNALLSYTDYMCDALKKEENA